MLKLQLLEDDDDEIVYSSESQQSGEEVKYVVKRRTSEVSDGRPAWMRQLLASTNTWLRLLPVSLPTLRRTIDNIKDPLYRFFEREVNSASRLLETVRHDLDDVVLICKAEKKQTNHHRLLLADLAKGIIPSHWKIYTIPHGSTVIQWITDFSDRINQLQKVSSTCSERGASALKNVKVWLGGLFNPEAYITATRQYVAQTNGWSLEELTLNVEIVDGNKSDWSEECAFSVTGRLVHVCESLPHHCFISSLCSMPGLKLQGAKAKNNKLFLDSSILTDLPLVHICWLKTSTTSSDRKVRSAAGHKDKFSM